MFANDRPLPVIALRLFTVLLGTSLAGPLQAVVINVAAGVVEVASDGQCSIREAIDNANADMVVHADCTTGAGDDTLNLPPLAVYEFLDPYPTLGDDNALPKVTDFLTILGNGSTFRRAAGGGTLPFRFLQVDQVRLELRNLLVENGRFDDALGQSGGGAILVDDGELDVWYSDFTGNVVSDTGRGGAILARGTDVTLTETRFFDNETLVTSAAQGGGAVAVVDGSLLAERCAFVGNNADGTPGNGGSGGIGGALLVEATDPTADPFDTVATVLHSTVSGNTANSAGAIALVGESGPDAVVLLVLDYVTLVRNDATVLSDGIGLRGPDQAAFAVYSNSVLHSNGSLLPDGTSVGDDCQLNTYGAFISAFGNLLDSDGECPPDAFDDFVTSVLAADLGVDVLVDHHTPVISGLLVDNAVGTSCTPGQTLDQLGKVRGNGEGSGGLACDIGSVEAYGDVPFFADGFESGDTSAW